MMNALHMNGNIPLFISGRETQLSGIIISLLLHEHINEESSTPDTHVSIVCLIRCAHSS